MDDYEIRRAEVDDVNLATDALAAAFADDPFMNWMMGEPSDPERRLRPYFRAAARLETRKENHEVFVLEDDAGEMAGVAVWNGVDDWKSSVSDTIRLTPGSLRSFRSLFRPLRALTAVEGAHPTDPHFYLAGFGVHPRAQGRGFGAALLDHMIERLDREGLPGYLESSNPRNVSLYARHGFEVSGTLDVPEGAPPVTPMWRRTKNP